MQIKQDPVSSLYCRSDGAILMPPTGIKYKTFRWTFGSSDRYGYKRIRFCGKHHLAHQIICRAFNGLAPEGKAEVDHINRIKSDNRPENIHWVDRKENNDNTGRVDQSVEKYGVRVCEDRTAYSKAYYETHHKEYAARSRKYRERRKGA